MTPDDRDRNSDNVEHGTRVSEQPEVVCLCGSTKFKDEYLAEQERLTMEGKIFVTVGLFGHFDDVNLSEDEKEMLDELHKRKIDIADRVHVIDVGGYIGDSTQSEIEYAERHGTPITYYSDRPPRTDTDGDIPDTCPECGEE